MPTLREYKNDTGHYISAWVSEAGNVTYQVDPEASHILKEVGYRDHDELPWAVIRALRAVGIVGIGNGEEENDRMPDEFDPEEELENLSSDVAEQLYAELSELSLANPEELEQVKSVLGTEASSGESPKSQFEKNKESFESLIDEQITKMTDSPDHDSIIFGSQQEDTHEFTIHDLPKIAEGAYEVRGGFSIQGQDMGLVLINFWGREEVGIKTIKAQIDPWNQPVGDFTIDWEIRGQVYEAIGDILKKMASTLYETGFNSGNAEGDISINITPI